MTHVTTEKDVEFDELFEAEMAEVKPMLEASIKSLSGIRRAVLVEIPPELPKNPPDVILWSFQGAFVLLGHGMADWTQCKNLMMDAKFVRNMIDLDLNTILIKSGKRNIPMVQRKVMKKKSTINQEKRKTTKIITTNISLLISKYNIDLPKPLIDIIMVFTLEIQPFQMTKFVSLRFWNEHKYNYEYASKYCRACGPLVQWTKSVVKYCQQRQKVMRYLETKIDFKQ